MSNTPTNASGYTLTIKVSNSFAGNGDPIPHAFVTISGPDLAPVIVGYYPQLMGVSGAGTVRNDALSHKGLEGVESHPYDQSLTFEVSPQQALNALNFAASTANNPGQYQLLGAADQNNLLMQDGYQCTGFARDVARAAGIMPQAVNAGADDTVYPSTLGGVGVSASPTNVGSYPGSLIREFGGLDSNQVQPFRSAPDAQAFAQARSSLYGGIAAHDPADSSGVDTRIKPVGEVVLGGDSGSSQAETTSVDKPATVFNPATALPSYNGDNAVTVQPGDTVSSIAKRYDMTVEEFSAYLKTQYGEGADLNSIVAGSKLPLPLDVYERTSGGVNGLDLPPETGDTNSQVVDAFSQADQSAADIKAQYPNTVQVADAGGDAGTGNAGASTNTETNTDLTKAQAQGGVAMFNAAMAAQHWGQMDDVQRAAVLGQMYMAAGQMSGGATSLGDGSNAALSGLNFVNALEHGQNLQALQSGLQFTQAGLSMYSNSLADAANVMMEDMLSSSSVSAAESAAFDAAAESAAESAAASNTLGQAVPYVAAAIALKNFEANPAQAALTYAGMYVGEAANEEIFRSVA